MRRSWNWRSRSCRRWGRSWGSTRLRNVRRWRTRITTRLSSRRFRWTSTGYRCTRSWRYRTCWRPQGWVQAVSVPGAGDTGPTGDHRGEYRLQVYQELDKQDLLETTEVSTDYRCTRSWTYRTYWIPQRWIQATCVPGAGHTRPTEDHRGEYRLQVYQKLDIQNLPEITGVSTGCKCTRSWRYITMQAHKV